MIPAWADSVLMYWGSSVAYENSGLDDGLIADLQAWDTSYCDGCEDGQRWRSQAVRDAHEAAGMQPAQRVADSLGRRFAVELDERIMESHRQAATPSAAAAFGAHAERRAAMLDELARQMAEGADNCQCAVTADLRPDTTPGQWLREVRAGTTRRVRVRLSPDYSVAFPVEVVVEGSATYVDADMLGISDSLQRDIENFQEWWDEHADDETNSTKDPEFAQWSPNGIRLVKRLQLEAGRRLLRDLEAEQPGPPEQDVGQPTNNA